MEVTRLFDIPYYQLEKRTNINIYNPNRQEKEYEKVTIYKGLLKTSDSFIHKTLQKKSHSLEKILSSRLIKEKGTQVSINNSVFRLFIWRDMFEEFLKSMA